MTEPLDRAAAAHQAEYDPAVIERKWQDRWDANGTNRTDLASGVRPFYALMMFPYPSAEGLHVGNLFAFTGNDIYGRFQRLQGHTVFEPIGFDAFGIHSENFALKVGTHPADLIPRNIDNFRRQLKAAGLMVDWQHELSTTDPAYYKWTQWLFLQLYKRGLAYRKRAAVNWCPNDKTVLANEQVIAGECERCGAKVEQRFLEQWFFRITDYAGRLLANLDWLDWSESTKLAQRNWIGRSDGAEVSFRVQDLEELVGTATIAHGATGEFPTEPTDITVFTTRPDTIFGATYLVLAPEHPLVDALTTDEQRQDVADYKRRTAKQDIVSRKVNKDKTGVFTGAFATNPATGRPIPIWIADYVLMEYGTGAIMAVPGHDERDFEFAKEFDLPIPRVVAGSGVNVHAPLEAPYTDTADARLVNSGEFTGLPVDEGKRRITAWLAERGHARAVVNYRLHDWCISRQRYWGPPIPIIYCDNCGTVPVPEADLPVELPYVEDFKPDDTGVSPLARVESWYRVACPLCAGQARRETDVSDTFLDSAWYFLRYPSTDFADVPFDPELTEKWLPVTSYIGGNEHAVLHLLYSRFVTMVLHDAGQLSFEEPYERFRAHGMIVREGAKMSKSRGNVVNPDEYVERWGADTFRTYLMYLGPYEEGGDFRDQSVVGVRRFLDRLWASAIDAASDGAPEPAVMRKLHQTIRKVSTDIPALSYNTAIAAMMEYMNVVRRGERVSHRDEVEPLVQLVSPFAPHLAEELWERLGHDGSIFDAGWPTFDAALAAEDLVTLAVQVNGKMRGTVQVPNGSGQEAALEAALAEPAIAKFVPAAPRKVIFVPGRLLNLVV
ncbi:MAG TPA: leucine--tRNA ligase [Gemmatimonadaceae bacterium]|jgi:leucyl-tRNA synthetase|nr:leucine--tRNA ligase [Gemmatimonadaceae bacterium]